MTWAMDKAMEKAIRLGTVAIMWSFAALVLSVALVILILATDEPVTADLGMGPPCPACGVEGEGEGNRQNQTGYAVREGFHHWGS